MSGQARPLIIALVLAACLAGAVWFYLDARSRKAATQDTDPEIQLSDRTRSALKRLRAPVEIRFYALLNGDQDSGPLRTFSERVDRLLDAYQQEAGDEITVTRFRSPSAEDMDAASADGIEAFNLARGEPCYLGLTLLHKDRKEVLPRLSPDWETALEADLTRAIVRISATPPRPETEAAAESRLSARQEVQSTIPNLKGVSLEQGRQILRERAFKELKDVTAELQTKVELANRQLVEARSSGSEEKVKEATRRVREAQAAQADQLRKVSARLDAQIQALETLKEEGRENP